MAEEATAQSELHAALQTTAHDDEDLEGSVLVGWVTVAEWMSPDGTRWLSRLTSEGATTWQVTGYLSFAMDEFGPVGCGLDEGEEDEGTDGY